MKNAKVWIITAVLLIFIGLVIFTVAMAKVDWDFFALSTHKFSETTHELTEPFNSIIITDDTADIDIVPTDSAFRVVCFESEKEIHEVTVKNGALSITPTDNKKWFDHIGINFHTPKLTLYVPKEKYDFIGVTVSTGDISIENIEAGDLSLLVSTGDVFLNNVTAETFDSNGSTGNVNLKNVSVVNSLFIERSTGNVRFENSDAATISVKTDTGDVFGTLRTEKIFDAKTDTGSVSVPSTASGGKCKITTDTGNIKIEILE